VFQLTRNILATPERITGLSLATATNRTVIDDLASRVQSARATARISAFLVDAGESLGALGAHYTLRPALRRRTDIALQARAHSVVVLRSALAVRSARRRLARIAWRWRQCCKHCKQRLINCPVNTSNKTFINLPCLKFCKKSAFKKSQIYLF